MDDVQELINEARQTHFLSIPGYPEATLHRRLADALEALAAEKTKATTDVEAAIRLLIPWGDN